MADLISLPRALVVFTPPLDAAQQATIPALISAASAAVERYCRRYFAVATYDEVRTPRPAQWDRAEPDYVPLRHFPIRSIVRVAGARTPALVITNSDAATNQRATVAPILDGDAEVQQTTTGLTLTHVASAVTTTAPLSYADHPTVGELAAAIAGQGHGWGASVDPGLESWASADLVSVDGPAGALNTRVTLDLFRQDMTDYRVDPGAGGLYLAATTAASGGPGAPWFWPQASGADFLAGSWRPPIRVTYTAGYTAVPEPVQQATAIVVQQLYFDQLIPNLYESQSIGDYSYKVNQPDLSIPSSARDLLARYVAYRF